LYAGGNAGQKPLFRKPNHVPGRRFAVARKSAPMRHKRERKCPLKKVRTARRARPPHRVGVSNGLVGIRLVGSIANRGSAGADELLRFAAADVPYVFRFEPAGAKVLALDRFVDFLAVDRDLRRRIDAEADLVAANVDDGDNDVITDNDAFVALSRQYKHRRLLPKLRTRETPRDPLAADFAGDASVAQVSFGSFPTENSAT